MIPPSLITSAVGIAAGFGLAWQLQANTITQLELDQSNERSSIQRAARQTLERHMQTVAAAQANAANRGVALRTAADSARYVGNGLRLTTAATVRAASSDPAACPERAAALGVVFGEAITELTEMAGRADRHASDAQTLIEAWPR